MNKKAMYIYRNMSGCFFWDTNKRWAKHYAKKLDLYGPNYIHSNIGLLLTGRPLRLGEVVRIVEVNVEGV